MKYSKAHLKVLLFVIASFGCYYGAVAQTKSQLNIVSDTLISGSNLDLYIDKLVTIKGEVSLTKIPRIIGVDVDGSEEFTEGSCRIATGILQKTIVLEKDISPYSQNRGAGTFFRLKAVDSDMDAKVVIIDECK